MENGKWKMKNGKRKLENGGAEMGGGMKRCGLCEGGGEWRDGEMERGSRQSTSDELLEPSIGLRNRSSELRRSLKRQVLHGGRRRDR
jgi:hypothetical protein